MPNLVAHIRTARMSTTLPPLHLSGGRITADTRTWSPYGSEQPSYFSDVRRTRAISLSRQLAISSPLFSRLITSTTDVVVPPGIQLSLPRSYPRELLPQLDWIWFTGPSALADNARRLIMTLFTDGELLLTTRVNKADGRITITDTKPDRITAMTRGEGISVVSKVSLSPEDGNLTSKDTESNVIRRSPDGVLDGDIFYFRLFPIGLSAGLRGLPLFIASLDDLASATELMYNRIVRLGRFGTHYWDITLTGASQDTIDQFLQSDNAVPPESGELFAHNEQVMWNLVGTEYEEQWEELKFFVDYIAGTAGLSPEFLGHSPGRDVTTESIFSALQHLHVLQNDVFSILDTVVEYAVSTAAASMNIPIPSEFPSVIKRDVASRLIQRQANSFEAYVSAISYAIEDGTLDLQVGRRIVDNLIRRFGVMPDPYESEIFSRGSLNAPPPPPEEPQESQQDPTDSSDSESVPDFGDIGIMKPSRIG